MGKIPVIFFKVLILSILIFSTNSCNNEKNTNNSLIIKKLLSPHESPSWEATLMYYPSFVDSLHRFTYGYTFSNKCINVIRYESIGPEKHKNIFYSDSSITTSDIDSVYNCFSRTINYDFYQDSLKEYRTIVLDGDHLSLSLNINKISKNTGSYSDNMIKDTNVVRLLQMLKKRVPHEYDFGFDKILSF